ncbi:MAG: DUF4402 domain-containing protein [Bacteroidota bacterium]|nr:DUF4402 domain-containing protein [Bacteroidota bacterium]
MKIQTCHIRLLVLLCFSLLNLCSYAQPTDDNPGDPAFRISVSQHMNFGAFTVGAGGGSVIMSNSGTRTANGNVILLTGGTTSLQAIFELELPTGTIVTVVNGPDATLTGNNGGSMSLQLGNASPASPFATTAVPPARTQVKVGGTLSVGNATIPGTYRGQFVVSFHYQ